MNPLAIIQLIMALLPLIQKMIELIIEHKDNPDKQAEVMDTVATFAPQLERSLDRSADVQT